MNSSLDLLTILKVFNAMVLIRLILSDDNSDCSNKEL